MSTAFSPTVVTPKITKRKSKRKGKRKPAPIASIGQIEKSLKQSRELTAKKEPNVLGEKRTLLREVENLPTPPPTPSRPLVMHPHTLPRPSYANLGTPTAGDPSEVRIEMPTGDDPASFADSNPEESTSTGPKLGWKSDTVTDYTTDESEYESLADQFNFDRQDRPPAMPQLGEVYDPNMPRGGVLRPKHINMGPYSVPMKNLSDNQQDIHERLLNLQQKASTNQTYDDLVLNENLRKLRGVMGPWNQSLTPAKTFRSENFLYTGVDNKENLNGDAMALGRPTRHYKITATKPVTTDPLNPRDPQFRVYNPAITRLPGISFFSSL